MKTKIQVIFHSLYGHVYHLASAIAEGAREVPGVEVELLQVQETLPDAILAKMGALEAKKSFAHVPVADPKRLVEADAVIVGAGTLQAFFDSTGALWATGALIGKAGGVFTSSATQHGGQETTLISMQTFLFHHGMVVVGVPYAAKEQMTIDEITGGSPYGSSTITGGQGQRLPSANELAIARFQGRHTAQIAAKLAAK